MRAEYPAELERAVGVISVQLGMTTTEAALQLSAHPAAPCAHPAPAPNQAPGRGKLPTSA